MLFIGEAELVTNAGPLPDLYLRLLSQNLADRLRSDPDFDPARFPNAAALFTNSRHGQTTTTTTTTTSQNQDEEDERKIDEALNQS